MSDWSWQGCTEAWSGVCPPSDEIFDLFGRHYNAFAIVGYTDPWGGIVPPSTGGVCPSGWRTPSVSMWQTLWDYAEAAYPGQSAQALMSAEHFDHPLATYQGFDAFGFNGTAHGVIISNLSWAAYNVGLYGGYWCSGDEGWMGGWVPSPYGDGASYTSTFWLDARNTQPSITPLSSYSGAAHRCIRETPV